MSQAATAGRGSEVAGADPVPRGTFTCVVDEHPRFHLDALRWFASLTSIARVDPEDLVVHIVGPTDSDAVTFLRRQGVVVHAIEAFDPRAPHCNKISGALHLASDGVDGMAVLCDSDIAVIEDPRVLALSPDAVASKLVDAPLPPLPVLVEVFATAGLSLPPTVILPWEPEQSTVAGNGNGGIYLVPAPLLDTVAAQWSRWARWLLDRLWLLQQWTVHADQVAMALALAAETIEWVPLEVRWNTPTHDLSRIPSHPAEPAVIHYHQRVERDGRIEFTGTAEIDRAVVRVNQAIADLWHGAFPNRTFWDWRYLTDPDLGSGDGSRGEALDDKRRLLEAVLEAIQPTSVLDVGCGDGEAIRDLNLPPYTGIDVSAEAVRRARIARPDGVFSVGTIADHGHKADLVMSLDVLIHESDPVSLREHVDLLWRATQRALVISGYERPPRPGSAMVHFHEPLSLALRRVAPEAEIYPVRAVHDITTLIAVRPPAPRHPRDFGPAILAPLAARHPDPMGLIALRVHAWETVGFYPAHAPRLWEYPEVARVIRETLPSGSRIVDVGAGVTPLPPFLTRLGYLVDTVDSSPVRRVWPPRPDWNEWEFLDYAERGFARRSWNGTLDAVPNRPRFHGIYSVSVIEHLPAAARRALLADMARRVMPGGLVFLTVDLVRNTDLLWNRNRGLEVEDSAVHGSLQDLVSEARRVGLDTDLIERVRQWGDEPVDIGMVSMRPRQRVLRWPFPRRRSLRSSRDRLSSTDSRAVPFPEHTEQDGY